MSTRSRIEVRGEWAGTTGDWRPAIAGTLNQTGRSDAEASTFADSSDALEDALAMVCRTMRDNARWEADVRVVNDPARVAATKALNRMARARTAW